MIGFVSKQRSRVVKFISTICPTLTLIYIELKILKKSCYWSHTLQYVMKCEKELYIRKHRLHWEASSLGFIEAYLLQKSISIAKEMANLNDI